MLRLYLNIISGLCLLISSLNVYAESASSVWEVSRGQQRLFVGGTIHVLSAADYPLPKVFEKAYQQADVLVFETDVSQMQTPKSQRLIIDKTQYKNGKTLRQVLLVDTYQRLRHFLLARGGDIRHLEHFKPGMLTILLTLNELERLGQLGEGVDQYYDRRAVADNKKRLFLETIEQQIGFLAAMGQGQEDALVNYTLKELEQLSFALEQLKSAWRSGDNKKMIEVALTPWEKDFPNIYQSILVDRNDAWIPYIETLLQTSEIEYILVGALHLVGEEGVLNQLRARGYQVEQLH